jgi:hypothetical protein
LRVNNNIIIVCWDFPPHHSIGGRRWAKIAKVFLGLGYNVTVITGKLNKTNKNFLWINEDDFRKMNVYYCSEHFLIKWLNDYDSPLSFLKIRIAGRILRLFCSGTIFDKANAIKKNFIKVISFAIVKHDVRQIFVTGAPFNLLYYCTFIKGKFPSVKIVSDYRDPWINAQNYGMKNLSLARKNAEILKQKEVFKWSDFVTAPNKFLLQEIKSSEPTSKINARFIELPHAYDPDDVLPNNTPFEKKIGLVKLIYGGTLYLGIDEHLKFLNESLSFVKTKINTCADFVKFYTADKNKSELFSANADCVQFNSPIGDKIFNEVLSSDYIIILLSEHNKNYLTSKFFEFLPYGKPYIYIGPQGFVSEKIEKEQLGFHLKKREDLWKIINGEIVLGNNTFFDITAYTFKNVVKNFIKDIHTN